MVIDGRLCIYSLSQSRRSWVVAGELYTRGATTAKYVSSHRPP